MPNVFVEAQAVLLKEKKEKYQYQRGNMPIHAHLKIKCSLPYIEAALQMITKGEYGICLDCGNEIPLQRLELVPAAIRCAHCQRYFEERGSDGRRR